MHRLRSLPLAVACLSASLSATVPAAADFNWILDLRARIEAWDAPSPDPSRDETFDFSHLRARLGFDFAGDRWSFRVVGQGAGTYNLPESGSFGIGPVYLAANLGDTDPSDFGLLEASVTYRGRKGQVSLGRQKWADGEETMPGVAYLDGVKRRRMGQRLVGNWDWPNVGRRYDGVSFGVESRALHLAGFGLVPLAGGVNYEQAFEQLDDITVYGLTLTGRYGASLGKSEWRAFAVQYEDERPGAFAASGGELDLTTLGASLLIGGERSDVLLWVATQSGDWGTSDHDALAWIAEVGRRLVDTQAMQLEARIGVAQSSGDDDPRDGDHETFFNLLPTNHKWYGAMDLNAFQNLRDLYLDAVIRRGALSVVLGLHRFELVEEADAWYGGSGAFNDAALGFAARRSPGGRFGDSELGHELDVGVAWTFQKGFKIDGGVSFFDGGDAAAEILAVEDDGVWTYFQLSWKL